jgi:hypothetical protein
VAIFAAGADSHLLPQAGVDQGVAHSPYVVERGKDVSRSVELFDRVNRQDFEACERTRPGMRSRTYGGGGVLVPSEHHIGGFHPAPSAPSCSLSSPEGGRRREERARPPASERAAAPAGFHIVGRSRVMTTGSGGGP